MSIDNTAKKRERTIAGLNKKSFNIPVSIMILVFYHLYGWYEIIKTGFISTFVIKSLGWEVLYGPLMTSLVFLGLALGRLSGIPLSLCMKPVGLLMYSLSLTTVGIILLALAPSHLTS